MKRAIVFQMVVIAAVSLSVFAQDSPAGFYADNYAAEVPAQPQGPVAPRLSPAELSNLVAPIALYPDMLLSQVLAASTYPSELMQARQWMESNPGLRGQQLVDAAKQQNWDPSIQALVAFPDVMTLLTRDIEWTTNLGNAFLSQQADVMDAIQSLRAAARDNGRLTDTSHQRVTYEQQNDQSAIVIQPSDPQLVYPPAYDPEYVWGPPAYGSYPQLGYPDATEGIIYGVGTFLGALFSGLWNFGGWGWGLNWLSHGLFLNNLFFSHFGFHGGGGYGFYNGGYGYGHTYGARSAWVHNPAHRLGTPYRGGYGGARMARSTWTRFGSNSYAANYNARGYNSGRPAFGSSNYHSSRQMEAYRGLSQSASRFGANGYASAGRGYSGGGFQNAYRGGTRNESSGRSWFSRSASSSGRSSEPRFSQRSFSQRSFSSPHFSAPKSSGHFGGGGHSGGAGGHFKGGGHSGGGHSHGGSHKHR